MATSANTFMAYIYGSDPMATVHLLMTIMIQVRSWSTACMCMYSGINTAVPGSSEGVNLSVTIGSQSAPENGITPHNDPLA